MDTVEICVILIGSGTKASVHIRFPVKWTPQDLSTEMYQLFYEWYDLEWHPSQENRT